MALTTFTFNIAKGRAGEFYNRVDSNDPANSALVAMLIASTASDATIKDLDSFAAIESDGDTAEITNSGYARVVLTDSDLSALSIDDSNDRVDLDIPDLAFGTIAAGTNPTNVIIGYDSDTTGGTDSNIIPISCHAYGVTPNGTPVTAVIGANGFWRAA